MKTKRSTRVANAAGLVLAAALTLTACSTPANTPTADPGADSTSSPAWAKIEKAANAEGQVTWYGSSQDSANIPEVAAFNKKYPNIQVLITRLTSGDLATRYSSEKQAGAPSADVIQISDNIMLTQHPEWFLKLDEKIMPNLAMIPADQKEKLVQPTYVASSTSPFTVTINTNLIKKNPKTWEDLIKSPWAGKGTLADPRPTASFMAAYAMLRETYGDDYLKKLGTSGSPFYKATTSAAPLVAAGSLGYLTPTVSDNTKTLRDAGAPLKAIIVSPIIALTSNVGINSKAAHPNAAKVFANFILSRQGQQATCNEGSQSFIYSDIPGCPLADSKLTIVDYAKGVKESAEIIKLLDLK